MCQRFRLAGTLGDGRHPYVNERGAFIGRGVPLLGSAPDAIGRARFLPRPVAHLDALLAKGYGAPIDCTRLEGHLGAVARALNDGDLARAAIALMHANLPPLPDEAAVERLAKADRELRSRIAKWREVRVAVATTDGLAKYNPDQPRVPRGRPGGGQWSRDGGGASVGEVRVADRAGAGPPASNAPNRQPDPPKRGLTPGEIALARSIFDERIDYNEVAIEPNSILPRNDRQAVTLGNTINFSGDSKVYRVDFSSDSESDKAFLLHEMTHILQNQNDVSAAMGHVFFPEYEYELQVDDDGTIHRPFSSYGTEQQAMIVQDYYRALHGLGPAMENVEGVNQRRYSLSAYRAVLQIRPDGTIGAEVRRPGTSRIER